MHYRGRLLYICFRKAMKKIAVIFLTLLYFVSFSGVTVSSFYCCGKLKEIYVFHSKTTPKNCKGNKLPGCCDTKTTLVKIKDNHSPSSQVKIKTADAVKIFYSPVVSLNYTSFYSKKDFSAFLHAPPLLNNQHVYLAVNNFRI